MKAWLQLARVSALPSAVANILLAFLIAHGTWSPSVVLGALVAASCCFYTAGMVLNDVFDVERDRKERPERPIPSGRIRLSTARLVGFALLAAGLGMATLGGWLASPELADLAWFHQPLPRVVLIATLLLICIVLYDGPLKQTLIAPFLMGACRVLNILLGASTFVPEVGAINLDPILGLPFAIWWLSISVGILITGVTLLARNEASEVQTRGPLIRATIVIGLGVIAFSLMFYCPLGPLSTTGSQAELYPTEVTQASPNVIRGYLVFLAIVFATSLRHLGVAIGKPSPKTVQRSVIAILRSLIMLDAAVAFLFASGQLIYPVVIAALLIPAYSLGKFIRAT